MSEDLGQEEEWVRQNHLAYVGLIGAGLLMVQPFLSARSLDLPAKICVVSFAVSIPLLAALAMVSQQEESSGDRRRRRGLSCEARGAVVRLRWSGGHVLARPVDRWCGDGRDHGRRRRGHPRAFRGYSRRADNARPDEPDT